MHRVSGIAGSYRKNVPSHCMCGTSYSINHCMICRHGGLTFIRHNELRDLTASWLWEVCHDVLIEPPLQPLSSEVVTPATANRCDDARTDIHARGFWGRRQGAFLDVQRRTFYTSQFNCVLREWIQLRVNVTVL